MANFLKSLFIKGVEIDTTGASNGNVLSYNGTKFAPTAPGSGSLALDDLSDVVVTSPEEFQGISYNGTSWVNGYIPLVSYVRNAETTTLTTGTCVYLYESTGDHATVKRADNTSDTTSSKTIGVVGANITASNNGPVITRGYVDGIDLSTGYTAGDVLWLGTNGAFTKTKPTAPDHLVFIGVVVRATNNGIIYVATQNGYELDEIHNVSLPNPQSGEFLKYNGSLWVADAIDLGTDTTGNYMSGISGTSPVSVSHTPGEGSSATVSLASGYGDTQNPYASKTANFFLAAPNGSAGAPTFRAVVAADIPTLNQSTTGNAATATTLQTSRNINGVAFNGSADITVTAAAGTLTGTTLASGVTASSLTSVGTLSGLAVAGNIAAANTGGQDAIQISPRSGGTNFRTLQLTTAALTATTRVITLPDTDGTVITTGNLSSITTVGTLSAGSIPATLLTGTVASARISGSYTGITAIGTLSSLTVDGANSSAISIGDWSWPGNAAWSAIESNRGYVLLGHPSATGGIYLRSLSTDTPVRIGANHNDTLVVGYNGSYALHSVTIDGLAFCNNWWRSTGQSGWYNETYGGGIYMTESSFVRIYNNKLFLASGIWDSSAATASLSGYNYVVRGATFGNYAYFTSNRINKRNIQTINDSGSLIDQLNPVTYQEKIVETDDKQTIDWKNNDLEYGFIAEEVAEVGSGHLAQYRGLPDGTLEPAGWKFHGVVSVLVAEVKELRKRVSQLETTK